VPLNTALLLHIEESSEVAICHRVVARQLVGVGLEILLQSVDGTEAVVESLAEWKLFEPHGRSDILGQQLVLIEHLPDVEVCSEWLGTAEVIRFAFREHCLVLVKRPLCRCLRTLFELGLGPIHLLERVDQLNHGVASVHNFAEELLVVEACRGVAARHAKPHAQS